jgi:hypothetical protein
MLQLIKETLDQVALPIDRVVDRALNANRAPLFCDDTSVSSASCGVAITALKRYHKGNEFSFRPMPNNGVFILARSINPLKIFAVGRLCDAAKGLLVLSMLTASGAVLAQTTGAIGQSSVPSSDKDEIPPGSCTPIGITASGEIVFPLTCKAFLERHRGPAEEPRSAARSEQPAETEKAPSLRPAQPAVAGRNEPGIRPVETTLSKPSLGQQKQAAARKKGSPRPRMREH